MATKKLPKKVLRLKDLTFILPDNFDGSLSDAIEEMIKYYNKHKDKKMTYEMDEENEKISINTILLTATEKQKLIGSFGIFSLVGDEYIRKDETVETENPKTDNN
jgi:hypothetical protein